MLEMWIAYFIGMFTGVGVGVFIYEFVQSRKDQAAIEQAVAEFGPS